MSELAELAPELAQRYPKGRERSTMLPLLRAAQDRDGYVTKESIDEIAILVGTSAAAVRGVASFYHMLKLSPPGKKIVSVCHNLACTFAGAESVISALEQHLGITCGETTPDGNFFLERVECLAACDKAPMLQIDYDEMIGPLTPAQALASIEEGAAEPIPDVTEPIVSDSEVSETFDEDVPLLIDTIEPVEPQD